MIITVLVWEYVYHYSNYKLILIKINFRVKISKFINNSLD